MGQPLDRRRRLLGMREAGGDGEIDIEAPPRPASSASQSSLLPLDQRARALGAIAGEVGLGIFGEVGGEGCGIGRDMVDRGIGEAGQRHRPRVDRSSPTAFHSAAIASASAWSEASSGARAGVLQRPAVEEDCPSALLLLVPPRRVQKRFTSGRAPTSS